MKGDEFGAIYQKLHASFGMLYEKADQEVWFNALNGFDFVDVDAAVSEFVYANNRRPTIADIADGARKSKARRTRQPDIRRSKTVKCPYCKDTGLIFTRYRYTEVARACTQCEMGRIKHPWDFKTDEEKEAYIREEEKQGLRPPRSYHEATKEFYLAYISGNV